MTKHNAADFLIFRRRQATHGDIPPSVQSDLNQAEIKRQKELLEEMTARNGRWFDTEMDKLDRWAEDRRASLKGQLDDLDDSLKEARKAARLAPTLPDKLQLQRTVRTLELKREEAWREYDRASREVDKQKDHLLDEISRKLQMNFQEERIFLLRWRLN